MRTLNPSECHSQIFNLSHERAVISDRDVGQPDALLIDRELTDVRQAVQRLWNKNIERLGFLGDRH
jgi:hypothetical protein